MLGIGTASGIAHAQGVNRRSFLRVGAGVGAAGSAAAAYLGFDSSSELPAPRRELDTLDPVAFGVLAVFAGRILAFEGAEALEVAHGVDQSLRYATPEARADTGLILGLLENALSGLLTRGQATLFSELTPEAQDLAIQRWGGSSIEILRAATNALRKLCLGVHYAVLENARDTGYPGPPLEKPEPPPIAARAALSRPWRMAAAEPSASPDTETSLLEGESP